MQYTLHELLNQFKVVVPQIQRDYAQGRDTQLDLRKDFIGNIKQSLATKASPLNLDFVYGYTEKISNDTTAFIPLDGQQRLTTLWLLHWYLAPREIIVDDSEEFNIVSAETQQYLSAFTYHTRVSSKRFCNSLISCSLPNTENVLLSKLIKDAPWFMASWNSDPTIVSMLNMLDTIQEENFDKIISWQNLINGRHITFDYIDIKSDEFKLTDELYIKMNSRGKPLTAFENFKAQFSSLLSSVDSDYLNERLVYQDAKITYQQYFAFKIDSVWMDLFWNYRTRVNISTDECFLNFINYIAELLYFKNNPNTSNIDVKHDFDFLRKIFANKQNILFLFSSFDFLASLNDIKLFFDELFNSLSTFDNYSKDYFLRSISDVGFDVKDKIIFYAVLTYCINTKTITPDDELKQYIRIVRNLLLAVRQTNQSKRIEYTTNLRLPNASEYCKFIDGLINLIGATPQNIYGIFADNDLSGFAKDNISSEKRKASLIIANAELKNSLFSLEEHIYIQGNTSNFQLNSNDVTDKISAFHEIWTNGADDSLIIRAFLTVGDYSVKTHNYTSLGDIWYFGSAGNWNRILTAADKEEREKVSDILNSFLLSYILAKGSNVAEKLQDLINNYDTDIKDWRYYFIKYKSISDKLFDRFNLYSWLDSDGFDINSLGNSGSHPLHSYHLNPYLIAIQQHFNKNALVQIYWGRFTDISYLRISDKLNIKCLKEGLKITPINDYIINEDIVTGYNLKEQGHDLILAPLDNKDRIEIAIELINQILQ